MSVYIDGKIYPKDEAVISVYDHGFLYGDGVFEGIRIYGGRVFKLREHLIRLYESARAIMLAMPMSIDEMERAVLDTVAHDNRTDGYIRLVVSRGKGNLGLSPASCPRPSVIIIVDDIQLYPKSCYEMGISVITSSLRRLTSDSLDPRIKSLNYLNSILAKIEANNAGCEEAVILNRDGFVAECTGDNIFIVKNGRIKTPAAINGALSGITRQTVLELALRSGFPAEECSLAQFDLYNADECFLTGTGAEIIPVIAIDGRSIGGGMPGEVTMRLNAIYREAAVR